VLVYLKELYKKQFDNIRKKVKKEVIENE